MDITSIVVNESNDGFTLTGEVEQLTSVAPAAGTVPLDVAQAGQGASNGKFVATLEDMSTIEVTGSFTWNASNNKRIVTAQLPASCEGKVLTIKPKDHSNFSNTFQV
ncbi:hypothetical protein EI546_01485 [Aequorivita sp. H23M31]|uniref:Uncharacterized protein n=1 Tax=Aequorivita ciconiae TaxID=2494375 RepID=A0A410FZP9_9FLAO|nr:hypothetical protein [Aequorivita sp. H23M31]QAA80479.1 hypothetical protein EI546_01485 [Aequorivita sp. H23M31]